jgi:hypothetical protein
MPETYTIIDSRGEELDFGLPNVRLRAVDGLGMPDVRHQSEQFAQQDGETYLDSRLQKRIVNLSFHLVHDTEAELWDAREELVKIVKVLASGFRLRVELPNGKVRQLNLRYDSAFTLPRTMEMHDRQQVAVIQAVAHEPLLYDPAATLWSVGVAGEMGEAGWSLGWPFGWGASTASGTPEIREYPGTWRAYPTITLRGPMRTPMIVNETTGHKLEFEPGFLIDDGDFVTIDLRPGYKLVTDSDGNNIPDALTDDSDIGSWHIAAHPEAVGGLNAISVTFAGGNYNSRAEIRFNAQFVGI